MKVYVVYYTDCDGCDRNILAYKEPNQAKGYCEWANGSETDGGLFDWIALEVVDAE